MRGTHATYCVHMMQHARAPPVASPLSGFWRPKFGPIMDPGRPKFGPIMCLRGALECVVLRF
jgi:hypothetical protein